MTNQATVTLKDAITQNDEIRTQVNKLQDMLVALSLAKPDSKFVQTAQLLRPFDPTQAEPGSAVYTPQTGPMLILLNLLKEKADSSHIIYKIVCQGPYTPRPVLFTSDGRESQYHPFPSLFFYDGEVPGIDPQSVLVNVKIGSKVVVKQRETWDRWRKGTLSDVVKYRGTPYFTIKEDTSNLYRWCLPYDEYYAGYIGKTWVMPASSVLRGGRPYTRPATVHVAG